MTRAMPVSTHGTAVVRSLSHSERMTAIMRGSPGMRNGRRLAAGITGWDRRRRTRGSG